MSKFRKKPVVIEAVRLTADNEQEVANWCGGQVNLATKYGKPIGGVCKPDIFDATYEAVEDS